MTALTKDSTTTSRDGFENVLPVKSGVKIYQGSLVMITAGKAAPAAAQAGAIVVGVAKSAPEDGKVVVLPGFYLLKNSSGSAKIGTSEVGKIAYAANDTTVSKTAATNLPAAGIVVAVRDGGVWVQVDPAICGLATAIDVNAAAIVAAA